MGCSSSQLRTNPAMSPLNAFPIEDLYTPEFLESLQGNTGYWQESNPHETMGEQIAWTTEEEIVLAKGWVSVSKKSKHGNAMNQDGFWCEVFGVHGEQNKTGWLSNVRYGGEMKDGAPGRDSVLWSVRSFNTESENASINLNTNVADEDEVQETRRPGGMDKVRAVGKNKGSKASGSSTMNDDALARLMVIEMTAQEKAERLAFMEIKRRDVKCREREVAAQEYRAQQEDIRFYLQSYDHLTRDRRLTMDEARAKIKAKRDILICRGSTGCGLDIFRPYRYSVVRPLGNVASVKSNWLRALPFLSGLQDFNTQSSQQWHSNSQIWMESDNQASVSLVLKHIPFSTITQSEKVSSVQSDGDHNADGGVWHVSSTLGDGDGRCSYGVNTGGWWW
ncbi:hypothetical protein Tco_0838236 [Tanacetum coccineum]|uniref:No apical meristem-associated C-terminal domain-containing protein n=1 Tax=Tanacetum coccineum TaxID=301880 RepID=A0ABQ5AS65_9ASTR